MNLTIGHLVFTGVNERYPMEVTYEDQVTLSGILADVSRERALHLRDDLVGMRGTVVPITFDTDPHLDGWWLVEAVTVDAEMLTDVSVTFAWALALVPAGRPGQVRFQSVLIGADLANDHTITGERWHAPPPGAFAYSADGGQPGTVDRVTDGGGTITVYRNIGDGVDPTWGSAPAGHHDAAAAFYRDTDGTPERSTARWVDPTRWQLRNGLVRISPGAAGAVDVESYDGTQWSTVSVTVLVGGTAVSTDWLAATLLRNDPAAVTLRLEHQDPRAGTVGRITVGLTVVRGSRLVRGYTRIESSGAVAVEAGQASTADQGGWIEDDATDANGNRWVLGSARSFTVTTASGRIERAAVTAQDWFSGLIVGYAAPAAGDAGADLIAQYVGGPSVRDRIVPR